MAKKRKDEGSGKEDGEEDDEAPEEEVVNARDRSSASHELKIASDTGRLSSREDRRSPVRAGLRWTTEGVGGTEVRASQLFTEHGGEEEGRAIRTSPRQIVRGF